jgi:hypothetical protein
MGQASKPTKPQERYKLRKRGKDKATSQCLGCVNTDLGSHLNEDADD